MSTKSEVSIFWFRRDLRFKDNTGLLHALDGKYPVLPIFIFDPAILNKLKSKSDARVSFIHKELQKLNDEFRQHNSFIKVIHNDPENAFKDLLETYAVRAVYCNRDYEPSAIDRDKNIGDLLKEHDIPFHSFKDHVIFEGNEVLKQDGTPFKVFTPFKKVWLSKFESLEDTNFDQTIPFERFFKGTPTNFPELSAIGFQPSTIPIPPREVKTGLVKDYKSKKDFPAEEGTSRLGIHFRFGTISIREKAQKASKLSKAFLNELIWRDFYSAILQHFPHVTTKAFKPKYDLIPWINDEEQFKRWCEGKTGYPMVDAGMRQLNETGFMHNRVRMIVSSFLSKHLLIDWRWGEAYFAEKLLDYELASNNGGWQWAAGTGTDAQPYFRVFNPQSQQEKFDPDKKYVHRWIPELDNNDYPDPIVEHKSARKRAIDTYKSAVSN